MASGIRSHIFATLLVLSASITGFWWSRDRLMMVDRTETFAQRDQYALPTSQALKAMSLNYDTFAASMIWIAGLVYFGDWRLSPSDGPPLYLESYARGHLGHRS